MTFDVSRLYEFVVHHVLLRRARFALMKRLHHVSLPEVLLMRKWAREALDAVRNHLGVISGNAARPSGSPATVGRFPTYW